MLEAQGRKLCSMMDMVGCINSFNYITFEICRCYLFFIVNMDTK